jgi:hypothetical protein
MSTVGNWRGPNIVKDGLVLYLDAGSPNSYINGIFGTSWKDISGNSNNGTLINGPTFDSGNGGSIVFDGTNDYISTTSPVSVGNTFTVNVWVKVTTLAVNFSTRRTIVGNDYPYTAGRGFFFVASGNNGSDFFISLGNDQKVAVTTTGLISANTIYMLSARVNGTDLIKLYRNGIEVPGYAVQNNGDVSLSYLTPCIIGRRSTGTTNDLFTGNIYNTQIYNRALSDTEILQNYNATKARFGL